MGEDLLNKLLEKLDNFAYTKTFDYFLKFKPIKAQDSLRICQID